MSVAHRPVAIVAGASRQSSLGRGRFALRGRGAGRLQSIHIYIFPKLALAIGVLTVL